MARSRWLEAREAFTPADHNLGAA